jgi:hypothetical protein
MIFLQIAITQKWYAVVGPFGHISHPFASKATYFGGPKGDESSAKSKTGVSPK